MTAVVPKEAAAYAAGLRFAMQAPWHEVAAILGIRFDVQFRKEDVQAAAQAWAEKNVPRDSIAWMDADYGPDVKVAD